MHHTLKTTNPFSVGMDITFFEPDLLVAEGTVDGTVDILGEGACAGTGAGADTVGVPCCVCCV